MKWWYVSRTRRFSSLVVSALWGQSPDFLISRKFNSHPTQFTLYALGWGPEMPNSWQHHLMPANHPRAPHPKQTSRVPTAGAIWGKIHPTLGQLDSCKEQKSQPSPMPLGWIAQNFVCLGNYKLCPHSFTQPHAILCLALLKLTLKILAHSEQNSSPQWGEKWVHTYFTRESSLPSTALLKLLYNVMEVLECHPSFSRKPQESFSSNHFTFQIENESSGEWVGLQDRAHTSSRKLRVDGSRGHHPHPCYCSMRPGRHRT